MARITVTTVVQSGATEADGVPSEGDELGAPSEGLEDAEDDGDELADALGVPWLGLDDGVLLGVFDGLPVALGVPSDGEDDGDDDGVLLGDDDGVFDGVPSLGELLAEDDGVLLGVP